MHGHAKFHYAEAQSLQDDIRRYGLDIPFDDNLDSLKKTLTIGRHRIVNRLAYADNFSCRIEQRAAGVARIDCSVCLNFVFCVIYS